MGRGRIDRRPLRPGETYFIRRVREESVNFKDALNYIRQIIIMDKIVREDRDILYDLSKC